MANANAPTEQLCPSCGAHITGGALACPRCGAALSVPTTRDDAGWTDLPPIADMTRLSLGESFCQIEGTTVPVADFKLAAGDSIYFSHHVLLWREEPVALHQRSLQHAVRRLFAGMPVFLLEARGPGRLAVSADEPGETIALPLNPRQAVHVREHTFLAAAGTVAYDFFLSPVAFNVLKGKDGDSDTVFPIGHYIDKFIAGEKPGLLLLHCAGDAFVRTLAPGQMLMIKPGAFVYKDVSVSMRLHLEHPHNQTPLCQRHIWLCVSGPGRVAIKSRYEQVECENSPNLITPFDATVQNW